MDVKIEKITFMLINWCGQNIKENGITQEILAGVYIIMYCYVFVLMLVNFVLNFDVDTLPQMLNGIINYYLILFDLIVFRMNIKKLQKILKVDDFLPIDYIDDDVKKEQQIIYNFVYRCIVIVNFIGFLLFCTSSLLNVVFIKKEFPYTLYHFVDDYKSFPYYYILYFIITSNGLVGFMLINGLFDLFYGYLSVIYCQILMLKILISTLNMENVDKPEEEETCYKKLKFYIKHHTKLLKYFKDVNEVYSLILFNQSLLVVLSCAVQLYRMAITENPDTVWNCVASIIVYMGHYFIQCAAISAVSNQIQSLSDSMYGSSWTNNPSPRIKNAMLMIIQRSQIGCKFKAGALNKMDLGTFTAVIKLSFSFYTLLKTMKDK